MNIKMDYGKEGLLIDVPEESDILLPRYKNKIENPYKKICEALDNPINSLPLKSLYKKGMQVGISVCDHTRAQPRNDIIKAIIDNLKGINKNDLLIFIATGSHRQTTLNEINIMFDSYILENATIVNHNSENSSNLKYIGKTSKGTPIEINKDWASCDLKITTGFVEPHFFAGFSGGPKMIAPGLAGIETIVNLHDYERIENSNSTWGITEGNPIHEEITEISQILKCDFSIDVTLNRENQITAIYTGELISEHKLARDQVKKDSMIKTNKLYDLVITSNSGYPLDQNLYQSIKGVSAAAQITKPDGIIVCVSECSDGIPFNSNYEKLLKSYKNPIDFLETIKNPEFLQPDQWQFQIQAQLQEKNKILLYSKLNEKDVSDAHLSKINKVEEAIEELKSKINNPSICVLPEGPQTIPYKA
ncbi:MAG: nickel-dependent lactate racemase [Dehalococcoidales bacterium]|nr:nickel-dependent lactate racemase [Dehalococcoidales bacterium]